MNRRHATVSAIAAVLVIAVVVFRMTNGRDTAAERPVAIPPAVSAPGDVPAPVGPLRVDEGGVPHGWRHDRDGALAAALSAVRLTGPIARAGFITRADMIASITTARFGPQLAAASAGQLDDMTIELGAASVAPGDVLWSEIPLTATVAAADDRVARVSVWSVLVVAVPDIGAPRQRWRTVTIDLAWETGDWKIDGWAAVPGPTPLLDANVAVATTTELAEVVAWAPVPVGGG